jgi:hypothetical protein
LEGFASQTFSDQADAFVEPFVGFGHGCGVLGGQGLEFLLGQPIGLLELLADAL